jgi:hypothetical protein
MYIGVLIGAILYGLILMQAYIYFTCQSEMPFYTMTGLFMFSLSIPQRRFTLKDFGRGVGVVGCSPFVIGSATRCVSPPLTDL